MAGRCQLEIVFSPARPDLAGIGTRPDPGGFIYRVRSAVGKVHIGGSCQGLDPIKAFSQAKRAARNIGFTEWRTFNGGGPYHSLREDLA